MPSSSGLDSLPQSSFLFTVCQVGAEATLKKELGKNHPELRFAYSRPGFVTFKAQESIAWDFQLNSVFARAYGLSFGKVKGDSSDALLHFQSLKKAAGTRKLRLHFWERDQHKPGDEPLGYLPEQWATQHQAELQKALKENDLTSLFEKSMNPKMGDIVVDCVSVEENEWWFGAHLHTAERTGEPGEKFKIFVPEEAPSRAFVKLEEAIAWSRFPLQKGDTAVEIGSAPGGACYALLVRGLKVVGIDPGEMAPVVLKNKNYQHISKPVAQVPREELPKSVEWLLLDMNIDPRMALFQVDRLGTRLRESLLGVILTVKLNQWKIAEEIPYFKKHLTAMGFVNIQSKQLASNRQEILMVGLTAKGLLRVKSL